MAEESKDEQVLHRLFEQVNEHIETRVEYITLTAAEKMAKLIASIVGATTIFVFGVLVLFFFSMGFAWWLGDFIGNRAAGFAWSGFIFVPISILVYRWIRPFVQSKIIQVVLEESEKNNIGHG